METEIEENMLEDSSKAMKKLKTMRIVNKIILFITILLSMSVIIHFIIRIDYQYKYEVRDKEEVVELAYARQDVAFYIFPSLFSYNEFGCKIENRLYVDLHVYSSEYRKNGEELTIEEVEEYLAQEYNQNGELNVMNPPDEIADYLDYFWDKGGREKGEEYWRQICMAKDELESAYGIDIESPSTMTYEQLDEMCNYVDDSNYPINLGVITHE